MYACLHDEQLSWGKPQFGSHLTISCSWLITPIVGSAVAIKSDCLFCSSVVRLSYGRADTDFCCRQHSIQCVDSLWARGTWVIILKWMMFFPRVPKLWIKLACSNIHLSTFSARYAQTVNCFRKTSCCTLWMQAAAKSLAWQCRSSIKCWRCVLCARIAFCTYRAVYYTRWIWFSSHYADSAIWMYLCHFKFYVTACYDWNSVMPEQKNKCNCAWLGCCVWWTNSAFIKKIVSCFMKTWCTYKTGKQMSLPSLNIVRKSLSLAEFAQTSSDGTTNEISFVSV